MMLIYSSQSDGFNVSWYAVVNWFTDISACFMLGAQEGGGVGGVSLFQIGFLFLFDF